jgi:hypothetical protein
VTNANMGVFRSVGVSLISCISLSTSKLSMKGDRSIWAVKELLVDYVKSPSRRLACGWRAGRGSPKRVLKCSIACIFFDVAVTQPSARNEQVETGERTARR